ncbi:glutamate--cysteine ligase [Orrella sp. 11846]|uniref:glutamate--cysteine ligase n=1 Tax=Orrella sp. 11846 TaxID=3409913 RepID=UPI003B5ABE59
MSTSLKQRLTVLAQQPELLANCLRGLEKEGLRTDLGGRYALTPHPAQLGKALTHPYVTTDYAEALLELITATHSSVDDLIQAADWVHRLTVNGLDNELIWGHSMPPVLPPADDIPIAWYGTSNTGQLKHVYRRGLAHRYGKPMQCIAGIHYNFSLPDEFWALFPSDEQNAQERQSAGYVALIRNFMRHSWLLMYLFGASPALNRSFLPNPPAELGRIGEDTLYMPWATSLRMSDLGYTSEAQSTLTPCYNDLHTFLLRLYEAVTTPWPAYEAIGDQRDGEWIQINCNLLQIENEYYSSIRPKRTARAKQRPINALMEDGVQYVEVRCLDIDPFEPAGISAQTARFLDAFLLHCALSDSPYFGDGGYCRESHQNFQTTVKEGRKPGLMLKRAEQPIALQAWAHEIFDDIQACAEVLAQQTGDMDYVSAIQNERLKVDDTTLTPSARVLAGIEAAGGSFQDFVLGLSRAHTEKFSKAGLSDSELDEAHALRDASIKAQAELEADTSVTFDEYMQQFNTSLTRPS